MARACVWGLVRTRTPPGRSTLRNNCITSTARPKPSPPSPPGRAPREAPRAPSAELLLELLHDQEYDHDSGDDAAEVGQESIVERPGWS